MVSAVAWLCSDKRRSYRIYDVLGEDVAVRDDVLDTLIRDLSPDVTVRVDARTQSMRSCFAAVSMAPLPFGVRSPRRLVVLSGHDSACQWTHGSSDHAAGARRLFANEIERFIANRTVFAETTLVLVSDRPALGYRARIEGSGPRLPGKASWETRLWGWEQRVRDYASGAQLVCSTPSTERLASGGRAAAPSLASRWLSRWLPLSQRQAEYVWARAGAGGGAASAVARDLVIALALATRWTDASSVSMSDFTARVNAVMGVHGSSDIAELILFGRRDEAFAAVAEHEFSASEWSKVLGYLSQRLDWLGPLHVALRTNEDLSMVRKRLNIHQKWILTYAHRENPANNIAKHYDRAKVVRCRFLLAECSHALAECRGVPPGFGEVLICAW